MKKLLIILIGMFLYFPIRVFSIEIGIVDLNEALNQSEQGIRSKNILERRGRQKQQEFKLEESEIRKLAEGLRNNPLLTPKAKANKEKEIIARQQNLREQVRKFEQEMRLEERRFTENIFREIKTVIRKISIKEKLDIVLEKNTSQKQFKNLLDALDKLENTNLIFTMPNSDTEGRIIQKLILLLQ